MEAPREIDHAEELANAGNKLGTWLTKVSTMESRLVVFERVLELVRGGHSSGHSRMTAMRSKISEFEARIKEIKSRADEVMDMIAEEQTS